MLAAHTYIRLSLGHSKNLTGFSSCFEDFLFFSIFNERLTKIWENVGIFGIELKLTVSRMQKAREKYIYLQRSPVYNFLMAKI